MNRQWQCSRCKRVLTTDDLVPLDADTRAIGGKKRERWLVHIVQPADTTGPRACGLVKLVPVAPKPKESTP